MGRRNTVSTTAKGRTIPPLVSTMKLYDHLFDKIPASARETLRRKKSLLDALLEDSKSLKRDLGNRDKQKLDEYMSSVRDSEKNAIRAQQWLNTPKPKVDPDSLALDATPIESPEEYLKCMFDLMFLALQTDSTRVITYSIGNMRAAEAWHLVSRRRSQAKREFITSLLTAIVRVNTIRSWHLNSPTSLVA